MAMLGSFVSVADAAVPGVPNLVTPAADAVLQPISFTASWTAPVVTPSAGAPVSYHIQFSTLADFSVLAVSDSGITDLYRSLGPLKNSTSYYWRVRAKNTDGVGAFTVARSVTTIVAAPVAVTLVVPADNAVNQVLQPVLKWRKLNSADSYQLQVSTNANFTGILAVNQAALMDTTFTPAMALTAGTTYYWRVSAKNAGGTGPNSTVGKFTTLPAAPAVPEIIGPADGAVQQPLPVVCSWHKAARAASYRVQISTVVGFGTRVLDTLLSDPDTVLSLANLNYATGYYWRLRSENAGGTSAYSAVRAFHTLDAPEVPVLVAPAAAALNVPVTSVVVWHKTARAVSYHVQVSANAAFTGTLPVNDSGITDTTLKVGPLNYLTSYYVRVSAHDVVGNSAYSTGRNFTTIALIVSPAPILASPADAATGIAPSPTLKWHPSLRAADYRVQVSLTPTFATVVYQDTSVKDTIKVVGALQNDMLYYWRVAAKNASGLGDYSEIRSFTTKAGAAGEPALVSPADNATNQPRSVTLRWKTTQNAVTYRLQVSAHADFTSPVLDDSNETDTTQDVKGLAYGTLYYWRVRAQNGDGNSAYSASRKFIVIVEAPAAPGLIGPADNAEVDRSLELKWKAVAGAVTYRVQVSKSATFATVVLLDSTVTDTTKALADLESGTTFFWRVRAENAGGVSAYSEIRGFKTKPPVGIHLAGMASMAGKTGFVWHAGFSNSQAAELEFNLSAPGLVSFTLINPANGRSQILLEKNMEAGHYRWSVAGPGLTRGISFLRMDVGAYSQTRKVFLP